MFAPGTVLLASAGSHRRVRLRVVREEEVDGRRCVWAATEDEWERARAEGREPEASLWPVTSLTTA